MSKKDIEKSEKKKSKKVNVGLVLVIVLVLAGVVGGVLLLASKPDKRK
jgi:flagellar basal body-associated protein FliL